MSDSPKGTPLTRQFLVELFCGGGFSASVGKMPAAVTHTGTHLRCDFEWTNWVVKASILCEDQD